MSEPNGSGVFPSIPGYRILKRVGEGGKGEVFQALDLERQAVVAIKVLLPAHGSPGERHEGEVMATLRHPHVVAIHESGVCQGRTYLVMEYVQGPSLRELMTPGTPWPVDLARPVLDHIAAALSYVHGRGVLHLDLKPDNVVLALEGQTGGKDAFADGSWRDFPERLTPKVTDFGLALSLREGREAPALSIGQGTVDYCAPEMRHGLGVDVRADVFALGTLAYELLTGRLPGRIFVPATRRQPNLPPALDAVLARALQRDADERYAQVEAFRTDLRRALA